MIVFVLLVVLIFFKLNWGIFFLYVWWYIVLFLCIYIFKFCDNVFIIDELILCKLLDILYLLLLNLLLVCKIVKIILIVGCFIFFWILIGILCLLFVILI